MNDVRHQVLIAAGGVFHGAVLPHDGPHARFNRAAALAATPMIERAIREHGVVGAARGLLRMNPDGDVAAMRALLDRDLGLPRGYVQALDAREAAALAGRPVADACAWFYPGGGYVDPRAFAAALLSMAGDASSWHGATTVAALERDGAAWRLLEASGATLARVDAVALCGHADGLRLLPDAATRWPLERVRGQTTAIPCAALDGFAPRLPLAGFGYVLPPIAGRIWCGAASAANDDTPEPRADDHARNLEQASRLVGRRIEGLPLDALRGRVGWRLVAADRLPLIGALPDASAMAGVSRLDQPRLVPRESGLFIFTALASRGITWAVLGAQALASRIAGSPCPLESSLLDAVDVARFVARDARRDRPAR